MKSRIRPLESKQTKSRISFRPLESKPMKSKPTKTSIDSCKLEKKDFSIVLDDQTYPKRIPLYHNNSIDFECLNRTNSKRKTILLWTNFNGNPLKSIKNNLTILKQSSSEVLRRLKCPVTNCELTFDRAKYNQSILVLFHLRNAIDKYPSHRIQNQRWVIFFL